MVLDENKQYKFIPLYQIDELTAIYDDYLFISRQHECVMRTETLESLADDEINTMYPDAIVFPWKIEMLNDAEKQEFIDFIDKDIAVNDTASYVILRHINAKERNNYSKIYAIPPRTMTTINTQLPSTLERCSFLYPVDATLGSTEFYIDGVYKARYTYEKNKDMLIKDAITDSGIYAELYMMMNLVDMIANLGKTKPYATPQDIEKVSTNAYATERVVANENFILEILGSFAEKVLKICREKYNTKDAVQALNLAQQDGLILSAHDLYEYINIRNFMRHQLDTLNESESFGLSESDTNKSRRAEYLQSYLNFCDTTLHQRAKSYIKALHQMQYIIKQINPNRVIRDLTESNNKFIQRVKKTYQYNVNVQVELNYPLFSDKYARLNKSLHKIMPGIKIIDECQDEQATKARIDEYDMRSYFLQTFQSIESMVIRHCRISGYDFDNRKAWKYIRKLGILTDQEYTTWQKYANLRNALSHSYFSEELRIRLYACKDEYMHNLRNLQNNILKASPDVQKLDDNVYEYIHKDGKIIHFDSKKHVILYNSTVDESERYTKPQSILTINDGICR